MFTGSLFWRRCCIIFDVSVEFHFIFIIMRLCVGSFFRGISLILSMYPIFIFRKIFNMNSRRTFFSILGIQISETSVFLDCCCSCCGFICLSWVSILVSFNFMFFRGSGSYNRIGKSSRTKCAFPSLVHFTTMVKISTPDS